MFRPVYQSGMRRGTSLHRYFPQVIYSQSRTSKAIERSRRNITWQDVDEEACEGNGERVQE
jgi:hypothetical protein